MKYILFLIVLMVLLGCQPMLVGEYTKTISEHNYIIRELCLNGVVYYLIDHSATPAFKPDGTLFLCNVDINMTN